MPYAYPMPISDSGREQANKEAEETTEKDLVPEKSTKPKPVPQESAHPEVDALRAEVTSELDEGASALDNLRGESSFKDETDEDREEEFDSELETEPMTA